VTEEKQEITQCNYCKYFFIYLDGTTTCLMKNDYMIVDGVNVFPKECRDYKMRMWV